MSHSNVFKQIRFGFVSASLVLACAAGTAMAADGKSYPGSMAVRWSGPTPGYWYSTIYNPSSSEWLRVDLPVLNDTGDSISTSRVIAVDQNYYYDINCSINTVYWNNTAGTIWGWWGSTTSSSGSSHSSQTLNTGGVGGASGDIHSYFSCAIPPTYNGNRSYIVNYFAQEG